MDVCQSNKIAELKQWDMVHVGLIGLYSKSITQQQPGGAIIKNNVSLACMIIELTTGWFEIFKVTTYDLKGLWVVMMSTLIGNLPW